MVRANKLYRKNARILMGRIVRREFPDHEAILGQEIPRLYEIAKIATDCGYPVEFVESAEYTNKNGDVKVKSGFMLNGEFLLDVGFHHSVASFINQINNQI